MDENHTRRRVLQTGAMAGALGVAGLAGCLGGGDDENGGGNGTDNRDEPDSEDEEDNDSEDQRAQADRYLRDNNAKNYDGSVADETGSDSVTVMVGAGDAGLAFDPAGVRVDSGTTITWEWTGNGGQHNVVGDEMPSGAELNSGDPVSGEGETFEKTLETTGTYGYYCDPHRSSGMYGAVEVVGGNGGGNGGDGGDSLRSQGENYLRTRDANGYERPSSIVDASGEDSVTVTVGGGESGLAFDPAGIVVDAGTSVTWEWSGNGGAHNVVGDEEPTPVLDSGEPVSAEGQIYTQTLDERGVYGYHCEPHRAIGMYGAVVVE